MCCFSGPVQSVRGTQIFARHQDTGWFGYGDEGRQLLAYGMTLSTQNPVAMILPLPTPPNSPEKAIRWIDLQGYPQLFTDMTKLFKVDPRHDKTMKSFGQDNSYGAPLEVVKVGNFDASFVPAVKDFARLDARFRLADEVWKRLPQYADWGFAVFKLKAGSDTVHPMAFEFPRRDPKKLFFPTVHIHDGTVKAEASFDHTLYLQRDGHPEPVKQWEESEKIARQAVDGDKSKGLLQPGEHVYRQVLSGMRKNEDVFV